MYGIPADWQSVAANALRYDTGTLTRFLALAVPLLVLTMALFTFTAEWLGLATASSLPGRLLLGSWLLESVGLAVLFLLLQGRGGSRWLDGLLTAWIAWLFRGPLLVLTLVGVARMPKDPWWSMVIGWLVLYSLCGLLLASLAPRADSPA